MNAHELVNSFPQLNIKVEVERTMTIVMIGHDGKRFADIVVAPIMDALFRTNMFQQIVDGPTEEEVCAAAFKQLSDALKSVNVGNEFRCPECCSDDLYVQEPHEGRLGTSLAIIVCNNCLRTAASKNKKHHIAIIDAARKFFGGENAKKDA